MQLFAAALALISIAQARVVTIHEVKTADPTTIFQSQAPDVVTNKETNWVSETIFQATTLVTTIPTGVVNTQPVSSKPNPVTQFSSYPHTSLSQTINPSTYSSPYTIVSTSTPSPSSTSTPSSSSTSGAESSSSSSSILAANSSKGGSSAAASSKAAAPTSSSAAASSRDKTTSESSIGASFSSSSLSPSSSTSASSSSTSSPAGSSSSSSSSSAVAPASNSAYSGPIFDPISTEAPPSMFAREDIPFTPPSNYDHDQIMQTNKFYGNLLLGNQELTTFAQPYEVFYSTDKDYYGMAISYVNKSQRVFGPDPNADPVEYYINPLQVKSLVLSAKEFSSSNMNAPSVNDMGPFSVNASVNTQGAWPNQELTVPISIGMGFVTGIYDGYTPRLFSQIGIKSIVRDTSGSGVHYAKGYQKYAMSLMNGYQWNVYVKGPDNFEFKAVSDFEVMGNVAASGADSIIVQVAVVESNESAIDAAAGAFPVGADIDGETNGSSTTYRIVYDVRGDSISGSTLLYALPHHVESFSSTTKQSVVSGLTVYSTTKGWLTGVLANTLEMVEDVNDSPSWLTGSTGSISTDALKLLAATVNSELSEDMKGQTDTTSTYTAGKSFDKFAYVLLVASEILDNDEVTKEGLKNLKATLSPWLSNTQPTPFIYDTLCKGVTSSAANAAGGTSMSDFGAPFYNDHHFHYGYYVHTAAVIAKLDKKVGDGTWAEQNKDWVNSLVRDVANPSSEDTYFPVSRMFDYFSGHSWAHGLFASGDGKDEESTSEDYNFAYGMKLWGEVIGDNEMAARGSLMLAILKRSLNMYFLFKDDNKVQPSNIIGNRVAGITFENKIDHTTYFGTNIEYIQGIQMIPLTPASVHIREQEFVQQEWNSLLASVVGSLDSGWAGILRANQALIDPKTSYEYFASSDFQNSYLDGGASRSWYLAFSGLLGGSS